VIPFPRESGGRPARDPRHLRPHRSNELWTDRSHPTRANEQRAWPLFRQRSRGHRVYGLMLVRDAATPECADRRRRCGYVVPEPLVPVMVKLLGLTAVPEAVVTVIGPPVARAGTVALI
jgi:hypothetical protein